MERSKENTPGLYRELLILKILSFTFGVQKSRLNKNIKDKILLKFHQKVYMLLFNQRNKQDQRELDNFQSMIEERYNQYGAWLNYRAKDSTDWVFNLSKIVAKNLGRDLDSKPSIAISLIVTSVFIPRIIFNGRYLDKLFQQIEIVYR